MLNLKNQKAKLVKNVLISTSFITLFLMILAINVNVKMNSVEDISSNLSTQPSLITESETLKVLTADELLYYSNASYEGRLAFLYNNEYSLEDRVKVYLGNDISGVSLVYYDLTTDENIYINESETFVAASTYKVGLNLLTYYLAGIEEIDLNETITFDWIDYEDGTGILQQYSNIGSYSIQELLDLSLIYSDNIATNMLGRFLGGHTNARKLLYNILDVDYDYSDNIITAEIESKILKYVYDHTDDDDFSHMIDMLTQTQFHDRLDKYLEQDIVAHKVGNYDTYIHDVGIILTDYPYILAIYTNNIENAEEKIGQISKAIYEKHS
jgi:beta-lactamase class A